MFSGIILIITSIALILFSSHFLILGSTSLAKKAGIPDLLTGLILVSLGSSASELVFSILCVHYKTPDLAIGNILGSNAANILLILGISATIRSVRISNIFQQKAIPILLISVLAFTALANDQIIDRNTSASMFSRIDGLILVALLILYILYLIFLSQRLPVHKTEIIHQVSLFQSLFFLVISIAGFIAGGVFLHQSAVIFSIDNQLSQRIIGLTLVSIVTSIPELASAIVLAVKRLPDIALGNLIGANILNVFFALGIASTFGSVHYNLLFNFDISIALVFSIFLLISTYIKKMMTIDRSEGIVLIIIYLLYLSYLLIF